MSNGLVKPCCWLPAISDDDVLAAGLQSIWLSEQMLDLRRRMLDAGIEGVCPERCPNYRTLRYRYPEKAAYLFYRNDPGLTQSTLWGAAPPLPEHLDLEVDDLCNLNCSMCNGHKGAHRLPSDLLNRLASEGLRPRGVLIKGGEPLYSPTALGFIYAAFRARIPVTVISNMTIFTKEILKHPCFKSMIASIDSFDPETYSRIRRGAVLERTLDNLLETKRVLQQDGRRVWQRLRVHFTVMKSNYAEIPRAVTTAARLGLPLRFFPVRLRDPNHAENFWDTPDDLHRLQETITSMDLSTEAPYVLDLISLRRLCNYLMDEPAGARRAFGM